MMDFEYRAVTYLDSQVPVPVSRYQYTACDAKVGQVRLLELQPSSTPDQPIKCKLAHYDLNRPPFFVALSYECGDPSQWECIIVDDTLVPVTLNLEKALRQLRSKGCPLLWVDSICIHQNDEEEKAEHIVHMKDIYHSANFVAVWLGDASSGSEKVMQMLNAIDRSRDVARAEGHAPWTPSWQHLQDLKPELLAFLQRSYWTRAWIIQEVAMGSKVLLFCGSQTVGWRGLEEALKVIFALPAFPGANLRHVEHLYKTRSERVSGLPVGLLTALCGGCEAVATDFHDKVYSTLGLIFDAETFVPRIDYGLSCDDMCIEMTKSWIRSRKLLDVILVAGQNSTLPGQLPSWVPSYLSMKNSPLLQNLSQYVVGQEEKYRCGQLCRKWSATGRSVFTQNELGRSDSKHLRVHGISVGSIHGLGATLNDNRPPVTGPRAMWKNERSEEALEESICGALTLYTKEYEMLMDEQRFLEFLYNFDSLAFGFWDTNMLKSRFDNILRWREKNEDFQLRTTRLGDMASTWSSALTNLNAWMTVPRVLGAVTNTVNLAATGRPQPRSRRKPRQNVWRGIQTQKNDPDMVAALQQFSDLINEGLRLMITDFGDVGWAHPAAEIGDLVVLLRGCSLPAVIRPSLDGGKTYRLVGHAYGYGIMQGEAWSTLKEADLMEIVLS